MIGFGPRGGGPQQRMMPDLGGGGGGMNRMMMMPNNNNNNNPGGQRRDWRHVQSDTECIQQVLDNNARWIDAARQRLGDRGVQVIAHVLDRVQGINLSGNGVGNIAAIAMAEMMERSTSLLYLNLSENNLESKGITTISEALPRNRSLKELYLADNRAGIDGAFSIAEGLRSNVSLAYLDFSGNDIGDSGASAFGSCLRQNSTLVELNLSNNNIGDDGIPGLCDGLMKNRSLRILDLRNNRRITDRSAVIIGTFIAQSTNTCRIVLDGTSMTEKSRQIVQITSRRPGPVPISPITQQNFSYDPADINRNRGNGPPPPPNLGGGIAKRSSFSKIFGAFKMPTPEAKPTPYRTGAANSDYGIKPTPPMPNLSNLSQAQLGGGGGGYQPPAPNLGGGGGGYQPPAPNFGGGGFMKSPPPPLQPSNYGGGGGGFVQSPVRLPGYGSPTPIPQQSVPIPFQNNNRNNYDSAPWGGNLSPLQNNNNNNNNNYGGGGGGGGMMINNIYGGGGGAFGNPQNSTSGSNDSDSNPKQGFFGKIFGKKSPKNKDDYYPAPNNNNNNNLYGAGYGAGFGGYDALQPQQPIAAAPVKVYSPLPPPPIVPIQQPQMISPQQQKFIDQAANLKPEEAKQITKALNPGNIEEIRPNKVELGQLIGAGSFGRVYRGRYYDKEVAIKVLIVQDMNEYELEMIRKETEIQRSAVHENIVTFFGVCFDIASKDLKGNPLGICYILEYATRGSFRQMLDTKPIASIGTRLNILQMVAQGMQYLHSRFPTFIVHRDLKSMNVLLQEGKNGVLVAKICDFGVSSTQSGTIAAKRATIMGNNNNAQVVGTAAWASPEALQNNNIQRPSDVYSFGCVIFEAITGDVPWRGLRDANIITNVLVKKQALSIPKPPSDCPSELLALMKKCLSYDPAKRPTFEKIIPLFDGMRPSVSFDNIPRGSPEWSFVENLLFPRNPANQGTLTPQKYQMIGLEKVTNELVTNLYEAEVANIQRELNQMSATRGGSMNVSANETYLFHGTDQTDPHEVCKHRYGLMKDYSGDNLYYGKGVYFSEYAKYCNCGYAFKNYDGSRSLLIASVVLGNVYDFGIEKKQDMSQKKLQEGFHSVVGGPHPVGDPDASRMMVVYKDSQCVPRFIVHYKAI